MKIIPNNYQIDKEYHLEEDVNFSNTDFSKIFNLKGINSCHVNLTINNYEDMLVLSFKIDANLTLVSSYSLEEFKQDFHFKDVLDFSYNEEDEEYSFVIKDSVVDLDPFILDIIVTNLPSKIIKKGEKLPESGDCFKVMTEEEYLKEKEEKKDSRWDALDKLDI